MDEIKIIREVLESYSDIEIKNVNTTDKIFLFNLYGSEYGLKYFLSSDLTSRGPLIFLCNKETEFPHVFPDTIPIEKESGKVYRYMCLRGENEFVWSILTYKEKVKDTVDRLVALLSLSKLEQEKEYQKEFIFYWNCHSTNKSKISIYLNTNREFQKLNSFIDKKGNKRFVSHLIRLNDKENMEGKEKKWRFEPYFPVYFIPIIDARRVQPPVSKKWNQKELLNIIIGKDFNRISSETYKKMLSEKIKTDKVCFVFGMQINDNYIVYSAVIKFKSKNNDTLFEKIINDFDDMELLKTKRKDFYYLNQQIGNSDVPLSKKILIIGAGSLGSYVAKELVKSGIKNLTIYDDDKM